MWTSIRALWPFRFRYDVQSATVTVTSGMAVVVNFTLKTDWREWSRAYDFGITENLKNDSYQNSKDIVAALTDLER